MFKVWVPLLVCFYEVVSHTAWPQTSHYEARHVYHEWSTTPRPYYHHCSASNQNYDCIFQRVIAEPRQWVYFTRHLYRQVTFTDSRVQFFPKTLIDASPNLELLNVAALQIEVIVNNAFQNAPRLKQLYMHDNLISSIKRDTFQGANFLTTLVLGRNRINQFEPNALKEMINLQNLYIDANRIAFLPFVGNNPYLSILKASHNNIARIGDSVFYNNSYLRELDLAFNELRSFNMTQLNDKQRLELVDVSSNQLTHLIIPNVIHTLRANNNSISYIAAHQAGCWVTILELSSNQFNALPDLRQCTNLEKLDLSYNQLEHLDPLQLSAMTRLGGLNLTHNRLFEILTPPEMTYSYLGWLDLSHNSLTVWPNNFRFQYAVGLGLSNNRWQCSGLESVIKLQVFDRGFERCQSDLTHYNGICCREHSSNDDVQKFSELAELIKDNNFHESLNEERTKERCSTSNNYQQRESNQNVSSLREQVAYAEASKQGLLEIDSLWNQINENDVKLQEASNRTRLTESQTESLNRNIDRFVNSYGVPREGLVTPQEMLGRVLAFVSDRNRNNAGLLERRKREKKENEAQLAALKKEIDSAKEAQVKHKNTLGSLKTDEKNEKLVRDKLKAQVNKNSPSIRGSTGEGA